MTDTLRADAAALDAFARSRAERFGLALALGALPMGAILWLEYRLMLLGFVALAPALIAFIEWVRARQARSLGTVSVRVDDEVEITDGSGITRLAPSTLTARITPRFAFVVHMSPGNALRSWTLPGETHALRAFGAALTARGANVVYEREASEAVFAILGGVLVAMGLRVVGAGLALGALAQLGLALFGRGGSWAMGLTLLAGSFAALVVAALARRLVTPPPA